MWIWNCNQNRIVRSQLTTHNNGAMHNAPMIHDGADDDDDGFDYDVWKWILKMHS